MDPDSEGLPITSGMRGAESWLQVSKLPNFMWFALTSSQVHQPWDTPRASSYWHPQLRL